MQLSAKRVYQWLFIFMVFFLFAPNGYGLIIPYYSTSSSLYRYIIIGLFIILIFTKHLRNLPTANFLFMLICLIVCISNNYDLANHNYAYIQMFCLVVLMSLFCVTDAEWIYTFENTIFAISSFYMIATLLFFFVPPLYSSVAIPIFQSSSVFDLQSEYNRGIMFGFTTHYSSNAIYLALGLIVSVARAFFSGHRKKNKEIILSFLFLFTLLLTGKRAHIIFSFVAIIVTYYCYSARKKLGRIFKIMAFIIVGIFAMYIMSFFVPQVMNFVNRFIETAEHGDMLMYRDVFYAYALDGFTNAPILGNGWMWYNQTINLNSAYNVHNIYIQLLAETGIVGFIFFVGYFIYAFLRAANLMIQIKKEGNKYLECFSFPIAAALMFQVFFICYGMSGNPLYDTEVFIPYLISTIAVESVYVYQRKWRISK